MVSSTKRASSHNVSSQLSHPLDLLFDPLYKYVANDNAFINIQKNDGSEMDGEGLNSTYEQCVHFVVNVLN